MPIFLPPTILSGKTAVLIPGGTGAFIGDMTSNGGLAAAFDGNPSKTASASARAPGTIGAFSNIGKNFSGTPRACFQMKFFGSTDGGYQNGASADMITLRVYGNASAPANPTDGTLLGTTTVANAMSAVTTVLSTDQNTQYQYLFAAMQSASGSFVPCLAQLEIYEAV